MEISWHETGRGWVEMKYQFIRHIEATEGVRVLEGAPQRMPAHMVAR